MDSLFVSFRRRTVTVALAAVSILVVSGVLLSLAFGLTKRKITRVVTPLDHVR